MTEMYLWLIGTAVAAICTYAIYFLWKAHTHPAQVLARQAASMNWVRSGQVKKDGYPVAWAKRSVRFVRENEEAVIWCKDATITLVRAYSPPTFNDFLELERWLANNPSDRDDEEADQERLYLREIDKFVTRTGYFEMLLEAHATDEIFFLACSKFHKAGYLAGESAQVVVALILDALVRHQKNRKDSIEFLAGKLKQFRAKGN